MRPFYLGLGLVFLALGIIGAVLPLMPSTIFIILAAWSFARSSARLENWLLRHRSFGPLILAWQQSGAIPRYGKVMACLGMTAGFFAFWLGAHPVWWLLLIVGLGLFACAGFIVSRPEPSLKD